MSDGLSAQAGTAPATSTSAETTSGGTGGQRNADSAPATTPVVQAKHDPSAMRASLERRRSEVDAKRKASSEATRGEGGRFASPSSVKDAPRPEPAGGESAESAEADSRDKPWAAASVRERLEREKQKQHRVEQEAKRLADTVASHEDRNARYEAAFKIQQAEIERLRKHVQEGRPFDPRDAELSELQLERQAREAMDGIKSKASERQRVSAEQAAAAQAAEAKAEQTRTEMVAVRAEIESALKKYPLAAFDEVVNTIAKNGELGTEEVAKRLHEQREAAARAAGLIPAAPAPVAPTTSRATSAGPGAVFRGGHTQADMMASLRKMRASQQHPGR